MQFGYTSKQFDKDFIGYCKKDQVCSGITTTKPIIPPPLQVHSYKDTVKFFTLRTIVSK